MKKLPIHRVVVYVLIAFSFACKKEPSVEVAKELKPTTVSTFLSPSQLNNSRPVSVAFDKANNLYFADGIARIFKVTPQGNLSLYAGSGGTGYQDGSLDKAKFLWPYGLAFDRAGNLYVADSGNQAIRKISPDGQVTTFAGQPYDVTSITNVSVDGIGKEARFYNPLVLTIDRSDNLFVGEYADASAYVAVIRKITPQANVTSYAGTAGKMTLQQYSNPSTLISPRGLAVNSKGELFIGCPGVIYKVSTSGQTTVYSGVREQYGSSPNGPINSARYGLITSLRFDSNDNLYIGETGAGIVRKIATDGQVSDVTGSRLGGYKDGPLQAAEFGSVEDLAFSPSGSLYVADNRNGAIRKITFE
ncbi:NHL repeat containing protein [Spirosoma linguale]|uniref:NHL repeat containing protein n=1 Tax=Spirosoma linguale (strain ATCC 33905 / DSM 74 / LMG 10896 / Claus 1) TaxID=504472 RepID=D2QC71_SPILD|nr:NHL repeat containing protein [Spirosoma linguale DSM 74]